jgi:threonine dehydratase
MTVQLSDIENARKILQGIIRQTPVLPDEKMAEAIGAGEVCLKAESLQLSGSFKVRGAYNKMSHLSAEEKARGVIAGSAGNHAQGVALAAKLLGIKSTIVMPVHAPLTKVTATKALGAEVVLEGATFDEAVAHSRMLQERDNLTYVHAFDDELVIAGQGTIGLEIAESLPKTTVIVVPIGGGGIISGIAIAAKSQLKNVRVIGVQAAGCAPVNKSLEEGKPVAVSEAQTIADGIAVKRPGEITLPLIHEFVDEVVEVTEDEIARGIYHCVLNSKLVVEGAGAAGVAALLANKVKLSSDDSVCAVLAGANIDGNLLARVLEQVMVRQGRYIIIKLTVVDRPGGIAGLLGHVAKSGANVIEIFHRRALWLAPLGRTGIELVLEVRDREHGAEVVKHLQDAGYHIERESQGDWD